MVLISIVGSCVIADEAGHAKMTSFINIEDGLHQGRNSINLKKIEKKRRRSQHIVERETGIACTETPTKNIAICNAGLVNGLSEEVVAEIFVPYGPIEQIVMIPGKSCSFISYEKLESSIHAFECSIGALNIGQDQKLGVLSYCEDIPVKYLKKHAKEMPPGFIILKDFVTKEEEELLLSTCAFEESEASGLLRHRQVKHFGYEFRYDINNVDKYCPLSEKIPQECDFLWGRLESKHLKIPDFKPDQLTVNYYKPGQGIPSHVDTHSAFEDPLIVLSLGSSVAMEFKHEDGRHLPVLLPERSLGVMSAESRYNWTHGITPRKLDIVPSESGINVFEREARTSFTFRKVRRGDCQCKYLNKCDSYKKHTEIENVVASTLEDTHVHQVYENIAGHFSETRHKPWPAVLSFVESLDVGSVLVDIGCGNGKYLGHNKDIFEIGCDRSFGLIDVCKFRGFKVFTCNCLSVPLRDEVADAVISIAVIHHLANEERRLQAIKEIVRVLRTGGKALIYVWAKNQSKDDEKSSYLKQDRKNRKDRDVALSATKIENVAVSDSVTLPVHTNRSQFKHKDLLVPWKLKEKGSQDTKDLFLRFYHVFDEGELENACKMIENVRVVKCYYDQGNWCVLIEKIK